MHWIIPDRHNWIAVKAVSSYVISCDIQRLHSAIRFLCCSALLTYWQAGSRAHRTNSTPHTFVNCNLPNFAHFMGPVQGPNSSRPWVSSSLSAGMFRHNPFHSLHPILFITHFNIIQPSIPTFSTWFLTLKFHDNFVYVSHHAHTCYMSHAQMIIPFITVTTLSRQTTQLLSPVL